MLASGAPSGPDTSRRGFLAAAAGSALGLPAFLAGCGSDPPPAPAGPPRAASAAWWARQQVHYRVNFANWPFYIDVLDGKHPSLERFTQSVTADAPTVFPPPRPCGCPRAATSSGARKS